MGQCSRTLFTETAEEWSLDDSLQSLMFLIRIENPKWLTLEDPNGKMFWKSPDLKQLKPY
jgi:hypothetical protein